MTSRLLRRRRRSFRYVEAVFLIAFLFAAPAASALAGFGAILLAERMTCLEFTTTLRMA